jgi:hypothetical protein
LFASSDGGALKIVSFRNIGIPAAVLAADAAGCTLRLWDKEGTSSAVLGAIGEGGKLNLTRDGKSVFAAPEPSRGMDIHAPER